MHHHELPSRRRSLFAGRWCVIVSLIIVGELDADIERQVMDDCFQFFNLASQVQRSHLTAICTSPFANRTFDMMEQFLDASDRSLDCGVIACMVLAVNLFGGLKQPVGITVNFVVTRIVLIVVMQLEAKLIGQHLQPLDELFVILEAAEFERDGSRSRLWLLTDHTDNRWRVVASVLIGVERPVTPT